MTIAGQTPTHTPPASQPGSDCKQNRIGESLLAGEAQRIKLRSSLDAVVARATVRKLADAVGYSLADQARLSTAVYEIARDIVTYAGKGQIIIAWREDDAQHHGLECCCRDYGLNGSAPEAGPADSSRYLSAQRLVDRLEITQNSAQGSCVTVVKWLN